MFFLFFFTFVIVQTLATCSDKCRSTFDPETYRPARRAIADPFAFTDASVLAGASRLALVGTRLLTAGGERTETINNSLTSVKNTPCVLRNKMNKMSSLWKRLFKPTSVLDYHRVWNVLQSQNSLIDSCNIKVIHTLLSIIIIYKMCNFGKICAFYFLYFILHTFLKIYLYTD